MKFSKSQSIMFAILLCVATVGLLALAYFGIGSKHYLGVQNIKQGLDLSSGVTVKLEADKEQPTDTEMKTTEALLRDRLDRKGWTEAEVAIEGVNRFRVDMPGVADADEAIKEIGQTAKLYFVAPDGETVLLDGSLVKDARMNVGQTREGGVSEPYVSLEFNDEGRRLFADATTTYINQQIAIVLDDTVLSAPVVQSAITNGEAIITGSFAAKEAEELAALIRAGSLPFSLNVMQMSNVGAKLGTDALNSSLLAGMIGFVIILLFMLFVYRGCGFAADWALIIFTGLQLVVLSLLGVTLTLPGIAGIILSIAMAIDANIIIFERIKEEISSGKTLHASLDAGFKRAFPAIFDSNITTLMVVFVLYYLGTGPIKGFAQTLIIGILISMFTALVITRFILKLQVGIGVRNPKLYGKKEKEAVQ